MNLQSFSLIITACLVFSCSPTETKTQETVTNIDTTKVEQKPVEKTEKFFANADEAANQVFLALKSKDFSIIKPCFANGNQQDEIISNIDEEYIKKKAESEIELANQQGNTDYTEESLIQGFKKEIISRSSTDKSIEGEEDFNRVLTNLQQDGVDLNKTTLKDIKYELEKANGVKNIEYYSINSNLNYGGANYKVSLTAIRFSKGIKLASIHYSRM